MHNDIEPENTVTDSTALVASIARAVVSTDPDAYPGETLRFLIPADDLRYAAQIEAFKKNRRAANDPAMRTVDAIRGRADHAREFALMRRDASGRIQCESIHCIGKKGDQVHVSPPVMAGNAKIAVVIDVDTDFNFAVRAFAEDYYVIRHTGSGNAKVDQVLSRRLPGTTNVMLQATEAAGIRYVGGGHGNKIVTSSPHSDTPLNPPSSAAKVFRLLSASLGRDTVGRAVALVQAAGAFVLSGLRLTVYSIRWGSSHKNDDE